MSLDATQSKRDIYRSEDTECRRSVVGDEPNPAYNILGAFGCGAFRNPPELVADVFREVTKEYEHCFEIIEYAVFHTEREEKNYQAFYHAFINDISAGP